MAFTALIFMEAKIPQQRYVTCYTNFTQRRQEVWEVWWKIHLHSKVKCDLLEWFSWKSSIWFSQCY